MPKKLFDLSDEDVAGLEAHRAARGLRSHVEAVRDLIRNRQSAWFKGGPDPVIKPGEPEHIRLNVPLAGSFERKPYQKGRKK